MESFIQSGSASSIGIAATERCVPGICLAPRGREASLSKDLADLRILDGEAMKRSPCDAASSGHGAAAEPGSTAEAYRSHRLTEPGRSPLARNYPG